MKDVLYVILNGSLNMSPGKAAAQAVHAAMMLNSTDRTKFRANKRRTVIVLEAKNNDQIYGITDYLTDANIDFEYYVDEGVNEVDAFSTTALVVEPIDSSDMEKREIFAGLPLFGKQKPKKKWYQRSGYVDPHEDYP
jgi:peptidyl-tRNA hydrolase